MSKVRTQSRWLSYSYPVGLINERGYPVGQIDESKGALSDISDRKARLGLLASLDNLSDTLRVLGREMDALVQQLRGGGQSHAEASALDEEPEKGVLALVTIEDWYTTPDLRKHPVYFEREKGGGLAKIMQVLNAGGPRYLVVPQVGKQVIFECSDMVIVSEHDVSNYTLYGLGLSNG